MSEYTPDSEEDSIGELQVAEYLLLLFAFDTYAGFLEGVDRDISGDMHGRQGLNLLKVIDTREAENIEKFLDSTVTRDVSKKQVQRTFRVRVSNPTQAGLRASSLRTVLNKGGASTVQAIFTDARARKAVKAALASHMLDAPSEALTRYAAIPIQNVRIKTWVRRCLDVLAGLSPEASQEASKSVAVAGPVEGAATSATSAAKELQVHQMEEDGSTSAEDIQASQKKQSEVLTRVQEEATASAKETMLASGELNSVPTKAEVVGIATAAAVAIASELGNNDNIPKSLQNLDSEQRAAALTDGRVLVAAGPGAGKSFTLVARVKYLVQDRKVPPNKVLVSSFNKKAALELEHKIGKAIGDENTKLMTVGTLHGTFRKAILKYGNDEEKAMFQSGFAGTGGKIASAVNRVWRKCYGRPGARGEWEDAQAPSTKTMMMAKAKWSGNDVSPSQALALASTEADIMAARWYEMYLGFKGDLGPGWAPNCSNNAESKGEWDRFVDRHRIQQTPDGRKVRIRLGDFDDMISVFRDVLKRRPDVQASVHKAFDHVLIDECQDLNKVQSDVLQMMTSHITDGADGKSFWMIGDPDQSIYAFRGAKPEQFTALDGAKGWKTRLIRANYRCPPEVVEMANRLVANNSSRMDKEANPSPHRTRGEASIFVEVAEDEASIAMSVAKQIKQSLEVDEADVSDNAVLCRTNKELNTYETALLLKGVPYARKGSSSFLGSPETKSFLGYVTLATGTDHAQMQEAFASILNTPNRFFVSPDKVERAVDFALSNYARSQRVSQKEVNPTVALRDPKFQEDLVYILKGVRGGFKADKALVQLDNLSDALSELGAMAQSETATTKDLFDAVLEMPGIKFDVDPHTGRIKGEKAVTFREELSASIKDFGSGDEDAKEDDDDPETLSLGNVSFLYALAQPDPEDPGDQELSPQTPKGFKAKMQRLQARAKDLRYDIDAWDKTQADLPPEERKPAPGVFLGTTHSTKGAQWPNVYVQMPKGRFPMEPRVKDGDTMTPERELEMARELEAERRLAYVALTRPSENLRILCPKTYGGKPAGVSSFVYEAGLNVGENVKSPLTEDPGVKTAASFVEDIWTDWKVS